MADKRNRDNTETQPVNKSTAAISCQSEAESQDEKKKSTGFTLSTVICHQAGGATNQDKTTHHPRAERQQSISSTESTDPMVVAVKKLFKEPASSDVMLRAREESRSNQGNIHFHEAATVFLPRFLAASSKQEKLKVSGELAATVKCWGGMFLDFDEPSSKWYIIGDHRAQRKCYSELKKASLKRQNSEGSKGSSTASVVDLTAVGPESSQKKAPRLPVSLPGRPAEDPLSRKLSVDQIFQSVSSASIPVFSSSDSVARLLMSQTGLSVELPPLDIETQVGQACASTGKQDKDDEKDPTQQQLMQSEPATESVENQGLMIQKILQSISRATQSAALGQGLDQSTVPVGFFASREWGNELGPVQQDVNFHQVFQTDQKSLAETSQDGGSKRDWNAIVMSSLEASISTQRETPDGAEPADAILFAAAAASLGTDAVEAETEGEAEAASPEPERNSQSSSKIDFVEPNEKDILLGRGGRSNNWPGNKQYLACKDNMQHRYLAAEKHEKFGISQELLDIVKGWGGRFLKLDSPSGLWYEIDDTTARKKCSQTLREINTPEERAAKRARYAK